MPSKPTKAASPPKVARGVQFAIGRKGDRNSTEAVQAALAASTRVVDAAAADRVFAEKNWRYGYSDHLVKNCAVLAGQEQSVDVARAGLDALHTAFEFVGPDGKAEPLSAVMARVPDLVPDGGGFDCGAVVGSEVASPPGPCRVPVGGRLLEGAALRQQMEAWRARGLLEDDAVQAIGGLSDRAAVDLTGFAFACLGASSEMGPVATLLAQGATVYAVDIQRPDVWRRLLAMAASSRGTLIAPLRRASSSSTAPTRRELGCDLSEADFCDLAGCNVLEQPAEIAAWILSQAVGQRLCVGTYVYLDGANFVRVAAAADAIIDAVCSARPDASLACLSSPTECYLLRPEIFESAARRRVSPPAGKLHRLWYTPLRLASGGKYCVAATPAATIDTAEGPLHLRDSYTHMQGPNYAFAKQVQRWRMLLARSRGHVCSANLGPMTLTRSILSNPLIGAGVKGAVHFGLEPFYAATSSALLAMLLVHDLTHEESAANPAVKLASPLQLFSENALHVGSWHAAFTTNSYTEVCALTYAAGKAQPYVAAGAAALAGAAAWRRSKL